MNNKIVLSARGLSIGYSQKKEEKVIASGINVAFSEGSLIALIGANGIGKSTLLRTLTGIQKPISGIVEILGKDIKHFSSKEISQNLAVVLTESLPPSNLTVFELVALGRQPYTNWLGSLSQHDLEKVHQAINSTGISHLTSKRHHEISDGQLQKVLIARALAQDTSLIILDEPTTHLDLMHKVNLLKLLKNLAAFTGKCILYSTHDLDLALQLSDEMVVMTSSGIVQNTPENLIAQRIFDTLFDDKDIIFDAVKGGFTIAGTKL